MRRSSLLPLLALVAAASFALGWLVRPGFRAAALPEAGDLRPIAKPCPRVGARLGDLRTFSEEAVRYAPGDSAGAEAVSFRRRGARAELLVIEAGMLDDELAAEAKRYDLAWEAERGWVVSDCQSAVRFQPGRP